MAQGQRMRIGVILPIAEDSEQQTTRSYAEIRELATQAEASGLDSIWVFDHLLFRFPDEPTAGISEAWTMLAALAGATQRVQLGTLVLAVPFRNPALLAKMADTLTDISGGRLILGVGAGWHKPEFDAFGYPFDHRVDRFEEALQIMAPLLREGKVDFEGKYYSARNCELRPHRSGSSRTELLVAGGKPRMLRLTARYADSWNTAWLSQADQLDARLAALHSACEEVGRDPQTLSVTVGVNMAYNTGGQGAEETQGKAITGTPEQAAEALLAFARKGVDHVICSVDPMTQESLNWLAETARQFRGV